MTKRMEWAIYGFMIGVLAILMGIDRHIEKIGLETLKHINQSDSANNVRFEANARAHNGFADCIRAQDNWLNEQADDINRIQGKTPLQFRRRKHL